MIPNMGNLFMCVENLEKEYTSLQNDADFRKGRIQYE
jgi:hypothetical protein